MNPILQLILRPKCEVCKSKLVTCPECNGKDPYVSGLVCSNPQCENSAEEAGCCGC